MNWKDEIKKYDTNPALKKLHRGILEYVEADMPPSVEMLPFNESLERKLRKILNMIEPKLNKGDH